MKIVSKYSVDQKKNSSGIYQNEASNKLLKLP